MGEYTGLAIAGASVLFNAGALWLSVRHLTEAYGSLSTEIRGLGTAVTRLCERVTRLEALDEARKELQS